jgi:transcriptional regulator with XRE-family HTH domain
VDTITNRVRRIFFESGLRQTAFARAIGVTPQYIWKILNKDDTVLSDRTISDISREFHVNEAWLRTGEGEIYSTNKDRYRQQLVQMLSQLDDDDCKALASIAQKIVDGRK